MHGSCSLPLSGSKKTTINDFSLSTLDGEDNTVTRHPLDALVDKSWL